MNTSASSAAPRVRSKRPPRLALLLAPIPGVGHWAVRRGGRGLLTFMVFAAGMNLVLLVPVMAPVARISPFSGWALAGASVLFSLADVTRIVFRGPDSAR